MLQDAMTRKHAVFDHSIRKPKEWQVFERATCVLIRAVLQDPNTQMNGRDGQPQHGVDIYGRRATDGKLVGVQCKKRLAEKITSSELRNELANAKMFKPAIDEFILATTAGRDNTIQECARLLTEETRNTERFIQVSVWGWNDIEECASRSVEVQKAFDPTYTPYLEVLAGKLDALGEIVKHALADRKPLHSPSDRRLLTKFQTLVDLTRMQWLKEQHFGNETDYAMVRTFAEIDALWRESDCKFEDLELQTAFARVMDAMRPFAHLTWTYLRPLSSFNLVKVRSDPRASMTEEEAAEAMNAAANHLATTIDTFLTVAHKVIPT